MARVIEKVKYTSPQKAGPFTVTLSAGFLAAPESVSCYMIMHGSAIGAEWALIEATVTGGVLNIDQIIKSSTAVAGVVQDTETTFISAEQTNMMNQNYGGKKAIFLLGQSNMSAQNGPNAGSDGYGGWNAEMDKADPGILQWRASSKYTLTHLADSWLYDTDVANTYTIAIDPLDHIKDTNSEDGTVHEESVGCGLTFAKEWKARFLTGNNYVALFPCGKGGTGIIGSDEAWNPDPNTGSIGGSMLIYVESLMNQFLAEHPDNEIVAILYQQGETDALQGRANAPMVWGNMVQMLIDRLRDNSTITGNARQPDLSKVPFVIGGIKPLNTNSNNNIKADGQQLVINNSFVGWCAADPSWGYMQFSLHADAEAQRHRGRLLIDAYEESLLNYPVVAELPGPLLGIGVTETPGQAIVTWNANTQITPAITAYEAEFKTFSAGEGSYQSLTDVPYGTNQAIFTGLINDTKYTFRIAAKNNIGTGPSATVDVTPLVSVVPTIVQGFTVNDGPTSIEISWDLLTFDPAVLDYTLHFREKGVGTYGVEIADVVLGPTIDSYNFIPASNNTLYEMYLTARNSVGVGAATATEEQTHSSSAILGAGAVLWLRAGIGQIADGTYPDRLLQWTDQSDANNALQRATTPTYEDDLPTEIDGDGAYCGNGDGWYLPEVLNGATYPGITILIECSFTALESNNVFYGIRGKMDLNQYGTTVRWGSSASNTGLLATGERITFAMTHAAGGAVEFYKQEGSAATPWGSKSRTFNSSTVALTSIGNRPYFSKSVFQNGYGLEGNIHNFLIIPSVISPGDMAAVMTEFTP